MDKIKNFFKSEAQERRNSLTKAEYACWWILRALLVFGIFYRIKTEGVDVQILIISLNLLASFTITLARILLRPIKIMRRLPFRAQTWLDIVIFFASFLGQAMGMNWRITSYDKILHVMAGFVAILIGSEIISMFIKPTDKVSVGIRTFSATGFSYIAIVVWEVYEFFVDYYWPGSSNQAYNISPDRDPFFFVIFGNGAQNENQWAVFDTNVDMLCAIVGSIPAIILLAKMLKKQDAKKEAAIKQPEYAE